MLLRRIRWFITYPNFSGVWQALNTAHWNLESHSAEALVGAMNVPAKVRASRWRASAPRAECCA